MNARFSVERMLFDSATKLIPAVFAAIMFAAGVLLLLSIVTPIDPAMMPLVKQWLPLGLVEVSHAAGTAVAVMMILIARGLWERIDTAWYLAIVLFVAAAVFSLTRELAVINAVLLLLCALLLVPCKSAFNRRSKLMSMGIDPAWSVAGVMALALAVWGGFYAYKHVAYAHELWTRFSYHGAVSRFLRALVVIAVTLGVYGLYRLFGIARRLPPMPDANDMTQLREVVGQAVNPQAWLALLGDKHILWNAQRTAFLMYGVSGKQWVVMGEPVGPDSEASALCWKLKEMAALAGARVSFYQVSPRMLPLVLDLGLQPYKIGEEAVVDVRAFDLAGKKGYGFRQTLRKFDAMGATFEVISPDALAAHMARLKTVSDGWLRSKGAREKRYSLGSFMPDYIRLTPVAVVRIGGEIMAFANLWPGADKSVLTLDLMRYDPASPPSIMEYLFLRLIDYAREQGYAAFSLGLAPLAGVTANPLSSAWHKMASAIYQLGGDIYNFEGLRAYKEKFRPDWQPRYFAIRGQEAALVPALMAVVALGAKAPKIEDRAA